MYGATFQELYIGTELSSSTVNLCTSAKSRAASDDDRNDEERWERHLHVLTPSRRLQPLLCKFAATFFFIQSSNEKKAKSDAQRKEREGKYYLEYIYLYYMEYHRRHVTHTLRVCQNTRSWRKRCKRRAKKILLAFN